MDTADGEQRQPSPLHLDRARAGSFGDDAERYDRARPRYPRVLIDRLLVGHPRHVIDVGCGTGIVSRLLVDGGADVVGVEPDERMAAVARRHGLSVETETFETWDPHGRVFDLLVSGQAWHWVDPTAGSAKAAEVVKPGGRVALFWNLGRPPGDLRERLDRVYRSVAPELVDTSVLLGHGAAERPGVAADALRANGDWQHVETETFPFDLDYRTAQWLDLLETYSDHRALGPRRLSALLEEVAFEIDRDGGSFVMHYETTLVSATRARTTP
jgi:SAM-dependent methyltransferase